MKILLLLIAVIPALATAKNAQSNSTSIDQLTKPYQTFEQCLESLTNDPRGLQKNLNITKCYKQFEQGLQKISSSERIDPKNAERYSNILYKYLYLLIHNNLSTNGNNDSARQNNFDENVFAYYQVTHQHILLLSKMINQNVTFEEFTKTSADDLQFEETVFMFNRLDRIFRDLAFVTFASPKFKKNND